MENGEMMTINISRLKVLDVELAIQEIIFDFENDIRFWKRPMKCIHYILCEA